MLSAAVAETALPLDQYYIMAPLRINIRDDLQAARLGSWFSLVAVLTYLLYLDDNYSTWSATVGIC